MQKASKLTNDFAKTKNESMTCKESKRNKDPRSISWQNLLQSSPSQHNIVRKRNPSCAQEQFVFFFVFVSNVSGVEFVSLLLVYLIFDTFCFAFCQWKQYKGHLFIRVSKYVIPVQFKPPSNKSTSRLNLIYPFVWHNKVVIPAPLWSLCWK